MSNVTDLAYVFKVLSDETRLKIIKMLAKEELCACHILEAFDITQPTLSYHMKLLVESQLVFSEKDGNWTRYSLNKELIKSLGLFFNDLQGMETSVREMMNCDERLR